MSHVLFNTLTTGKIKYLWHASKTAASDIRLEISEYKCFWDLLTLSLQNLQPITKLIFMNKSYLTTYVTYWKSKCKARSEIYQHLVPNFTTHRGRTGLDIRNKISSTTRLGKLCKTSVPFLRIVPVMDCALPVFHIHSRNKNDPLWFHGKVVRPESVTTERNWLKKLIESRNTATNLQNNDAVQSG